MSQLFVSLVKLSTRLYWEVNGVDRQTQQCANVDLTSVGAICKNGHISTCGLFSFHKCCVYSVDLWWKNKLHTTALIHGVSQIITDKSHIWWLQLANQKATIIWMVKDQKSVFVGSYHIHIKPGNPVVVKTSSNMLWNAWVISSFSLFLIFCDVLKIG